MNAESIKSFEGYNIALVEEARCRRDGLALTCSTGLRAIMIVEADGRWRIWRNRENHAHAP